MTRTDTEKFKNISTNQLKKGIYFLLLWCYDLRSENRAEAKGTVGGNQQERIAIKVKF